MNDLIFALISPEPKHANKISDKLRALTLAWSRYGYHGEFIEESSIDQALQRAAQTDARYCLIQSAGHVIDEQWYLSHWQKKGFYQGINQLIKTGNFLVAGEWYISEHCCVGLRSDCLLVDLQCYQALGQPFFGQADNHIRNIQQCQLCSKDTSLLQATNSKAKMTTDCAGWNFIQISLQNKLTIRNFGDDINNCRFNLAEHADKNGFTQFIGKTVSEVTEMKGLTNAQGTFIKRIKKQLLHAKNGVFLFNIESYHDLIQQYKSSPLDAVFSVAAGFKPYRILYSQGYNKDTQVVLFDYSQKALQVRRYIVENWDGDDFVGFVRKLFKQYPQPEVFYQLWYGVTPDTMNWKDMEQLWQEELAKWGGTEAFKQHWQQCRKLPHKYIHCDLLKNRQTLLDELSLYNNSYIWWSNAFFTIFSHWYYSATQRKQQYLGWIKTLADVAPNCQINGADHNNIAVNGLSAQQYFQQFNQQHSDELIPQNLHRVDIQF